MSITPYLIPQMLKDAPLGIDWTSIGENLTTALNNLAALWDICLVATGTIDRVCFLPLRATTEVETLEGPDFRVVVPNTGVTRAIMSHWPVIAVLGADYCPSTSYPRNWTPIPPNMLSVYESMNQILQGSELGISGGDGMNEIEIAPGYITWGYGRNGLQLRVAYTNGWPHAGILPAAQTSCETVSGSNQITVGSAEGLEAGLPVCDLLGAIPYGTVVKAVTDDSVTLSETATNTTSGNVLYLGYPAGTTELKIDTVCGMTGTRPRLWDSAWTEQVQVSSVSADSPVEVLPTVTATVGTGTVTLSSGTRFAHAAGSPAVSLLTTIPDSVRMAGYFFAGAEALTRGATAISVQAVPGSQSRTAGPTLEPNSLTAAAERRLKNFMRVV